MAEFGLALSLRKDEVVIFHRKGVILGKISCSSKKTRIVFMFPGDVEIDREILFLKKYPKKPH